MLGRKTILKMILVSVLAMGLCWTAFGDSPAEKPSTGVVGQGSMDVIEAARLQAEADAIQEALEAEIAFKEALENAEIPKLHLAPKDGARLLCADHPVFKRDPSTIYFEQDFEGETFPPVGWDTINTDPGYGFFRNQFSGGGTYAALVTWHAYGYIQDEWLLSPDVNVSGSSASLKLEFWMLKGYSYPHEFKVYVDEGTGFVEIWDSYDVPYPAHEWYYVNIDMSGYSGKGNVQVGFQYYGEDADLFGLDDISLNDEAPAEGRCCYGDPAAPDCSDVTQADCEATPDWISWTEGLNCTDDPCPIAGDPPVNDLCADAIDVTGAYPVIVTGTTIDATIDCPGVLDWDGVWYKFDLPYATNNVSIDYCGTASTPPSISATLFTQCSCDEADFIYYSWGEYYDCGDGYTIPRLGWDGVAGPATVWYCVWTGDAKEQMDFYFELNVEELIAPDNDNCVNAEAIGETTDYPFSTATATTDGDGYANQNIWYCYTASQTGLAKADLCGSTFDTKMAAYDGCTCDPLGTELDANDDSPVCDKSLQSAIEFPVTAGYDYLIEVGGYGSASGAGDLTIYVVGGGACCDPATATCTNTADEATCLAMYGGTGIYYPGEDCAVFDCPPPPSPGDNCSDPIEIKIPGDLPYSDLSQYTCTRVDDYDETCLGSYDGGEDIIYELDVDGTVSIMITLDPKGTTYTGFAVATDCPPTDCLDYETAGYSSDPYSMMVELTTGFYYLMIDTWPSPDCIPDFDLTITAMTEGACCDPATGTCTPDVDEATCLAMYGGTGVWHPGIGCDPNPCPPPPSPGDNCTDPIYVTLPADMPYSDIANYTCGRFDNYANTDLCYGYGYGGGEDLAYELTVTEEVHIQLGLDPKTTTWTWIEITEHCPPAGEATCVFYMRNTGSGYYQSDEIVLAAGTYYIYIDTWPAPDCIPELDLFIFAFEECIVECPPEGIDEGEPCGDDTNGGCNSSPPVFTDIACGETICGTAWADGGTRDTDWFEFILTTTTDITWTVNAEFDVVIGVVETVPPGSGDCATSTGYLDPYALGGPCQPGGVVMQTTLSPGIYWVFVAMDDFYDHACADGPWDYTAHLDCGGAAEPTVIVDPDEMYWADANLVVDEIVTVYMGGSSLGFDVNDVNLATVLVNSLTPLGTPTIGTHPDMTGDVMVTEVSKKDFVDFYGIFYGTDDHAVDVTGDFTAGGSFAEAGSVSLVGHVSGDVNMDGDVNVLDIIYLINFKYKSGPTPVPFEEMGDVNASGDVNILDILYLINYKYKGGPAPMHP